MAIETILLDFDGTLHDSSHRNRYCFGGIEKYFRDEDSEQLYKKYLETKSELQSLSPSKTKILNRMFGELNSTKTKEFLSKKFNEFLGNYWNNEPKLYSGAEDLLKVLNGKYNTCLVTGSTIEKRRQILGKLEILQYFDKIIASKSYDLSKSDVEIYRLALKTMDSKPENTVMIGNEDKDILAGKIGIHTILIRRTYDPEPSLKPNSSVEKLSEVPKVLEELER